MSDTWDKEDGGHNGMFAIMWDCYGLEAVAKIPDPADTTFALLKGTKPPEMPALNHWRLRAQFNTARCYEIWLITAVPGIDEDDIRAMFEKDPQGASDTIRRIGQCFHSDREKIERVIT